MPRGKKLVPAGVSYRGLVSSFERTIRAENKSPHTVDAYLRAVRSFGAFLDTHHLPTAVTAIGREHVESWVTTLLAAHSASTANTRYRGLQQFFKWCLDEDEIDRSPMERMTPPRMETKVTPVPSQADLTRLLKACEGKAFDDRRDMALLRLLVDTGMRRAECATLALGSLDLDLSVVAVLGKGRKQRVCPFGSKTNAALDRYLRVRRGHPHANDTALWVGQRGGMTDSGVNQIVERRAKQAGLAGIHSHLFRHAFAHRWMAGGGQETDLMVLAGWRSRAMVARYGASAAVERAQSAYRRLHNDDL